MASTLLASVPFILGIGAAGYPASAAPAAASAGTTSAATTTGSQVAFAGVNIAGFDFGCDITGTCNTASTFDVASQGTGLQQMQHFV